MTKKDFELIARVVKEIPDPWMRAYTARKFCAVLANTNPQFKPSTFLSACGVKDEA